MQNSEYVIKYLRKCRTDGLSKRTISLAIETLDKFIKWCESNNRQLDSFSDDDIYDYIDYLDNYTFMNKGIKKHLAENTKCKEKLQVRKFLNFIKLDLGSTIKIKNAKNNKLPDSIFSKEEVQQLIDVCQNERDRCLIAVFYESGARKGELLALRIKHIVFDQFGAVVNITEGKTGSRRIRLVWASSYLHNWIDTHPLKNNRDAYLFCSLRTPFNVITKGGLFAELKVLARRAGIPEEKAFPHNFRHSRATHLSEHLTEAQLKEFLGWTKNSNMTSVYIHLAGRDIDNAILKMNKIETDETKKDIFSVGRCPRCKEINPENSIYCGKCGLPLKETEAKILERVSTDANIEMLKAAMSDPEFQSELVELLKTAGKKS